MITSNLYQYLSTDLYVLLTSNIFTVKIAEFAYFLFKYRDETRGAAATSQASPVETCNWRVPVAVSLHVANIMFALTFICPDFTQSG